MRLVTVYYNDVFVSTSNDDEPFEVYKDCPYVNLPYDTAEETADQKIENHDWDAYLIPELTSREVIYHV
jgi:hypothetical protein